MAPNYYSTADSNKMDFGAALSAMKAGEKVKRPQWVGYIAIREPDDDSYMNRCYIFAVCKDGEIVPAVINNLDMLAEDWQIA